MPIPFTDEAAARLLIAATAVPPERFEDWLQDIVARLEQAQPPALSPGARYTREWRARARAGRILLRVEADEAALAVTLIDRGLLDPLLADHRDALARATERLLAQCGEPSHHDDRSVDKIRLGLCLSALPRKRPRGPGRSTSG